MGHLWIKKYQKQLNHFSEYRLNQQFKINLVPGILLFLGLQIITLVIAYQYMRKPLWMLFFVPAFVGTAAIVAAYSIAKRGGTRGAFYFSFVYFLVVSIGILELSTVVATFQAILMPFLIAVVMKICILSLLLCHMARLIKEDYYAEDHRSGNFHIAIYGAILGTVTYQITKHYFSASAQAITILFVSGGIEAVLLFLSIASWLKYQGWQQRE